MKQILALALTLIMLLAVLTGCNSSRTTTICPPLPPSINLYSLDELAEMREMASCNDEEKLNKYLISIGGGGARSREDLVSFLELIDSLPVPILLEGDITWINYENGENDYVSITTKSKNGDCTRVDYLIWEDAHTEIKSKKFRVYFKNSTIDAPIKSDDGRITVYTQEISDHLYNPGDNAIWLTVIDDILVRVTYYSEKIDNINAENIFDNPTISTLKDIQGI